MDKKVNKKKVSKPVYLLKNLFLVCLSGFFIYTFVNELSTTFMLKKDISEAQTIANQLAKERSTLEKQQEMLQDPNYVINYARGKLLISQDGEQIFYLDENK